MRASTSRVHTDIHCSESSILPMLLNDIRLENFLSFSPPFFFFAFDPCRLCMKQKKVRIKIYKALKKKLNEKKEMKEKKIQFNNNTLKKNIFFVF